MPPLYKVPQVATILGVKDSTIYGWVDKGKIPHIRAGRLIRFTPDQITDFLQRNTRRSGQLPSSDVKKPMPEEY
jgi:excisionase family DNA binding protein